MDKQRIFNAIIVDTNAFDGKGNDFCGYHSKLLPSFFDTIRRLNIQLISHPILKEETIKHIKTGDWMNKPENAIKSITKYKTYLEIAKVSYNDIIKKLEGLDLCKNTIDAFKKEMSSTLMLPYPDPEKVFKKYFSNEPPFSESGAKKSEFPDAFVIEAIKQYLIDNPTISVLIVVKDKDWQNAFGDNKNILVTDNIDTALQLLNKHEEKLEKFILELNTEIKDFIENNAISDIWFEINEYECTEDIDSEYVRLITIDEDYVPLQITDTEIVLQTKLQLEVDGSTVIFDYDNSIWDNEEREYIMTSFSVMEFRDAKCNVTCEIYIALDEKQHPSLKYVKLIEPFGVNLEIDEEKVEFTDLNFV